METVALNPMIDFFFFLRVEYKSLECMNQDWFAEIDIKSLLTGVQWAVTKRKVIRNTSFIFWLYLQVKQEY